MIPDLTTVKGVRDYMSAATSEADWNNRCDAVKATNNGYPPFWFDAVVMSGLAHRVAQSWGGSAELKVTALKREGE